MPLCTAIQTERISKKYNNFHAVKDVSLSVNKGGIYGFIGLNGAGKTTTIRMLLGMIRPTQGTCYIDGKKVGRTNHRIWRKVGYIVETPHSYPELTVEENLHLYQRLRSIESLHAAREVMDQLRLTRYATIKAKDLSLGNAQRLGIAKALLHKPDIVILDEPFNGLDPAGIVEVRRLFQDLAHTKGVTIFISSHLLGEIAKIATKIGMIHEGQLIQEIDTSQLYTQLRRRLIVDTRHNPSALSKLSSAGYPAVLNSQSLIEIHQKTAIRHPESIARFLVYAGIPPTRLTVEEEDLESHFLRAIEKKGDCSS